MKKNSPSFFLPLYMGIRVFCQGFTRIALFELCYKAISSLILQPLLSFILQLLLNISGNGLAFNEQIWSFAFSLPGILAAVILVGVSCILVYFEFAVVISIILQIQEGAAPNLSVAISRAIWSFKSLRSPGVVFFALYSLVLLPLIHMGVTSSLLPNISIPSFITGELTKTALGEWAFLFLGVVVFLIFFSLLFVLPSMVVEHTHFGKAVKRNMQAIKAYGPKMIGIIVVFIASWVLMFVLPRMLSETIFGMPNVTLLEALNYWGFSPRTPVILLVWLLIAMAAQVILMPLLLTILTSFYIQVGQPKEADTQAIEKIEFRLDKLTGRSQSLLKSSAQFLILLFHKIRTSVFLKKYKRIIGAILIVIMAYGIYQVLFYVSWIHDPIVIGHRGSAYAVENTLEAIDAAVEGGADYVELDVMLSFDQIPVVVHDANLNRLTGQNVNVYDLTAKELSELELKQNGLTGQISTLEEVLDHCEGKILLAIEFKPHGKEIESLVEKTMELVKNYAYQKDCIIFSMDYSLVTQMIEQYPQYKVGYCVYGNLGQLSGKKLSNIGINFLCVEEGMVSKDLISTCRKAGIPVYTWTVNDAKNMEAYYRMGILGLITDYPDTAANILHSSSIGQKTK